MLSALPVQSASLSALPYISVRLLKFIVAFELHMRMCHFVSGQQCNTYSGGHRLRFTE